MFFGIPKSVKVNVESILKGEEDRKVIELISSPKYLGQNVIQSTVILRNGYHLIFACNSGDKFQPTTSHSVYDIMYGKLYPIWRPDQYKENGPNGEKVSSGIPLEEVINKIKNGIKINS